MAEKREKLWLRCVNLGENPSYAEIATFVKSVSIADLGLDLNSGAGLSHYEVEPKTIFPSIEAFKKLCHYFYSTFEYWMRHKDLTDEQVKWIDNNMLNFTLNFRKMSLPNHKLDFSAHKICSLANPCAKTILTPSNCKPCPSEYH